MITNHRNFIFMKKSLSLGPNREGQRDNWQRVLNCDLLSPREREVMVLAAKGFANKQIARELKVAEGTVKLHLHRTYQKLGIKSRFALAVLGRSGVRRGRGDPSDAA
jgi:DNA-binding NarL/FixJ family response regulator